MLKALNPSQAVPGRVRSALDTLAEALLVVDRKSNVVLANKAFQEIVGSNADAILGRKAAEFNWHNADNDPSGSNGTTSRQFPWEQAIESKETLRGSQLWLQDHNEEWHKFLVNCSPIITGKTANGVLISLDDVTELEEKEKELRLAVTAAEEANAAKSSFLSNMSHEIRTPMTAILGFTEVLKRGNGDADVHWQKHLNTISSSGKHLLELINDVLDLSKVESGALEVENIDCAPHIVASDVVQVLRVRAEEKSIDLEIIIPEDLPETIQSDSSRLRQIITNLVGNAIKFTEQGGVQIILRATHEDGEYKYIVDVKDSGIGMNEQQQSAVFKPFVQADSSITRRFGGTGLGLAISRKLARALGGDITVTSEANVGTTFTATISAGSLHGVAYLTPNDAFERMSSTESIEHLTWEFPQSKLLVIDDAAENRELITLLLSDLGLDAETAENGAIGVEMASKQHYDVILSDIQMPVMDGYEAARTMRSNGIEQPIIALTANAMKGYEETIMEAGFSHYMTKPIDIDALTNLLAKLLNGKPVGIKASAKKDNTTALDQIDTQTAANTNLSTAESEQLIYSRLGNSAKLGPIVEKFIDKLHTQLPVIETAFEQKNYSELAALGHWLKGSGGTIGFTELSDPAKSLEDNAKAANDDNIKSDIEQIRAISRRLRAGSADEKVTDSLAAQNLTPDTQAEARSKDLPLKAAPIESTLLVKNPAFKPIVMKFLPRLRDQIGAMEQAVMKDDLTELANLAHWLKGSGGTVGFDVFTEPATLLEQDARAGHKGNFDSLLNEIKTYADNIIVPDDDEDDSLLTRSA